MPEARTQPLAAHAPDRPSDWVQRWAPVWPEGATVLDLACGSGRHARWLADRGLRVTALDRDGEALARLAATHRQVERIEADLEAGPWPLADRRFDVVLVTNYLWRPLLPAIVAAVAPGGCLLYETFAQGQARLGRPRRPEFLLAPGELLDAVSAQLVVQAYEAGLLAEPIREVQRICAWRPRPGDEPGAIARVLRVGALTP